MSELKITQNSLENAILKDGQFVSGYVADSVSINVSGYGAHAEGYAVGRNIDASGNGAHAEGISTQTLANGAHAEGISTTASGEYSHAEGANTTATGVASHAGGIGTMANQDAMTAIGKYNITGEQGDLFVVGSGGNANDRKNAMRINEGADGDDRSIYWYFNDNAYLKLKYNPGNSDSSLSLNHKSGMVMIDNAGDLYMGTSSTSSYMSIASDSVFIQSPRTEIKSPEILLYANDENTIVSVNGKVHATGGFYDESDIRKKDILSNISLEKSYELLDKCQEIIYTLKEDSNKKEQIGMIAQEVEEFFPEIVSTDNNGFKSLDYARLSVICLRLIKDTVEQIKELKNEIKNLKN